MSKSVDLDNLLEGYLYHITSENMTMATGKGGAERFVKTCREMGMPDEMIKEAICLMDGEGNKVPLSQVGMQDEE